MSKLLFLTPNLSSGGAERQMVTIAKLLDKKGFNIEFLCYSRGDFYSHLLTEDNIPINWYIQDNYLLRIINVRRFIRKGNYDIVISFLETANFLNNFSAIGHNRFKVITGERSAKSSTFVSKRGKIFAYFQRFSDKIVCNSNNAKKMWLNHYPQYRDKLTTTYNPVLLPEITSEYIPKRNNKLNILIAASYQYLKNPIGLVNALSLLNEDERNKIEVNWYGRAEITKGNTKPYDDAISLIKKYHLESVVHLNEATKDIANKMNEADIVALFSRVEGLPNAICEGMSIGKPIIMTRVSDYSVLVDETNGFLCDWDDTESIKDALVSAIKLSEEELLKMGENSKKKAERLFSSDAIVGKWIEAIEN